MATTPKKKSTVSAADFREDVEALYDSVVNGDDQHWQAYTTQLAQERALGMKAGMYKPWSVNNRFYLHAQVRRRRANVIGLYAGVAQWASRGRSIREGEEPFAIFGMPGYFRKSQAPTGAGNAAPVVNAQATNASPAPATSKQEREFVSSAPPSIEVYDWTQTVSDDPDFVEPDWGVPLAVGDLDTLRLLTQTSPVPVRFVDIGSRLEHGWLDREGITIDASMPVGNQIFTLAHELAHYHLGHLDRVNATTAPSLEDQEEYSVYAACEQEAALAQFLTMKMLGLDEAVGNNVTEAAGAYLRSWMKTDKDGKLVTLSGHKPKRKAIRTRLDAAFKVADLTVTAYAQALEAREHETVPA